MRALAVSLLLLATSTAFAEQGRGYHNDALKLRFEAPVGWEAALGTGSYPRLLASYENRDGGRLTLVGQKVAVGTTARALVDESRPALERQGFRRITVAADGERVRLQASIDGGRQVVRQLYAVTEGMGFVITIVGPTLHAPQLARDFDEAAAALVLGETEVQPRR